MKKLYPTFYANHAETPATGWSAEYTSSSEQLYARLISSVDEIFQTSLSPVSGSITYKDCLSHYHERYAGGIYCEIGINNGGSLKLAHKARLAVGVDPAPKIKVGEFESAPFRIFRTTSDRFFSEHASSLLDGASIDMCFIDGLHVFEFALRDFIGAERFSNSASTVLIHDVLPRTEMEAARIRVTNAWTGDVWRLVYVLQRFRPDLKIRVVDARPTGLAIVSGLDSRNTELLRRYAEIVSVGRRLKSSEMMRARNEMLLVEAAAAF